MGILAACSRRDCYSSVSMTNLLGVDFFRVVSEPVGDDWSQVYAKIPFEKSELLEKGAVFGAVRLLGGDDVVGRGSEVIAKIEDEYNNLEGEDRLRGLFAAVKEMERSAQLVLIEIRFQEKERWVRIIGTSEGWVDLVRDGKRVNLLSQEVDGQVVRGRLKEEDTIFLGVGGLDKVVEQLGVWGKDNLEEVTEEISSELMSEDWPSSMAGLFLRLKQVEQSEEAVVEGEVLVVSEPEKKSEKIEESPIGVVGRRNGVIIGGVFENFKGMFGKVTEYRRETIQLRRSEERRPKKWTLIIGGVFLLILVASVAGGYTKMQKQNRQQAFRAVYEPIEKKREDAEALLTINPTGSRELMIQVREEIEKHKDEFKGTEFETEWNGLVGRSDEGWRRISGENEVSPELFYDLSLLRNGFVGERVGINDDLELMMLDSQMGLVATVSYPNKGSEILMGKGGGEMWRDVTWVGNKAVVMSARGMWVEDKLAGSFSGSVGDPVGVGAFGSYLYVLDKGNGEIWKYNGTNLLTGAEMGTGVRWITGDAIADLTDGVDLSIDGDIWVGLKNGAIIRLRRGAKEAFNITGAPKEMKIDRIAVNEDQSAEVGRIAILNKDASRVVVLDKNGTYVKQFRWSGFSEAEDLVFVDNATLIVVAGGKVYKVGV